MPQSTFNIVVKKLLKNKGKLINTDKIKTITSNVLDTAYSDKKAYKIIYFLKNRGYLISLKKDLFYVKDSNEKIPEEELIERFYWNTLKNHCKTYLNNDRYIGGQKALEFNLMNYDIPDDIDIINPGKQSREVVLTGKYIRYKKYSSQKIDLFKKLKKFTEKVKVGKNSFLIANLEMSILESLYNPDIISEKYIQELIKKTLRKYKKTLDFDIITDIIKLGKHHSSINRLYIISRTIDPKVSEQISDIIKKYSFFLDI